MQNYKDLNVWFKSHEITLEIYSQTKGFPKEETEFFQLLAKDLDYLSIDDHRLSEKAIIEIKAMLIA